jgi:hypothetical protein
VDIYCLCLEKNLKFLIQKSLAQRSRHPKSHKNI